MGPRFVSWLRRGLLEVVGGGGSRKVPMARVDAEWSPAELSASATGGVGDQLLDDPVNLLPDNLEHEPGAGLEGDGGHVAAPVIGPDPPEDVTGRGGLGGPGEAPLDRGARGEQFWALKLADDPLADVHVRGPALR